MLNPKESEKPKVIEYLYKRFRAGEIKDGVVSSGDVSKAINATKVSLSTANPANFLKDIVRSINANSIWPDSLKTARVTARQRYGAKRVFQFIPYRPEQKEPFPDRFAPDATTPVQSVASTPMSFVARQLGRKEESWLTQIVVNLRLVESQLSIFSPLRARVRDVIHLQMGMKTQPEIDAVFLASYGSSAVLDSPTDLHMLVSCEAKQINQRILEDQMREQVAMAMQITQAIKTPRIDAVKPVAITVKKQDLEGKTENAIYVVEFEHINRADFNEKWLASSDPDERLYSMPLEAASQTLYRILPPISGLNA
jgi:hypothetical protein